MSFDRFVEQIHTAEQLSALIGTPSDFSLRKELKRLDEHMRKFIAHSPFAVLSTHSAAGRCDASPRGDTPGFVHVVDDQTLLIPDRLGNKRVDSYRNILETGRIGLLFMVPGLGETLRINGRAILITDPA
ncbi:MAG: phosphohydrolase, partial [Planctomycetaceae bacterium]|nr:phosphohydrolase [Planctomycetaceae bacterium]